MSSFSEVNGAASTNGQSTTPSMQSAPRPKSHLVALAEREDRNRALIKGYLRKENSAKKWQKRWFEIVGHYFVYYKRNDSPNMLCAMDLYRAQNPTVVMRPDGNGGQEPTNTFTIRWDRHRLFRADTPGDAVRWVNVMRAVQDANPANATRKPTSPAMVESSSKEGEPTGGCCVIM